MNTASIIWYTPSTGFGFAKKDDGTTVLLLRKNIGDIIKFERGWLVDKQIQYRIEAPQVNIALGIRFVKQKKGHVVPTQPPAESDPFAVVISTTTEQTKTPIPIATKNPQKLTAGD